MRYLADPATIDVGIGGWAFVLFMAVALPLLAVRQHRALGSGRIQPPPARAIYASALATHATLLLVVWAVASVEDIDLFPTYRLTSAHVALGVVVLASGLVLLLPRFHPRDPTSVERTRLMAPRSRGDYALFYAMSITAGVTEELAYRGLLFTLLAALTRSWWIAAFGCAALFGVMHFFQGWRSAGIVAAFGLRDHIVVGLTGSLAIPIVTHALHDMVAGTVLGGRARRES